MGKLGGYLRLMRPVNCLMMGFAVIVGAALAGSNFLSIFWTNLIYGFITGFMLTASSMAINDYHDREIDAVNEPNRPIPSGSIKPEEALIFASALTVLGLVTAFLTNITNVLCFVTAVLSWMVSVAYVTVGKRTGLLGNFLVSICVAIPFIFGSLAVSAINSKILVFASMVFLSNTGREVTKGIVDVQGDKMRNVKTLAVCYGKKNAAMAAALFYVSAVLLSPIPRILDLVSLWFIPFVVVTDLGLVASSFMLLRDYSRENARRVKKQVLAWFLVGLVAFIVGSLS